MASDQVARLEVVMVRNQAAMRDYVQQLRRDPAKAILKHAKLAIEEIIAFTPPFGTATHQESWRDQQIIGMNAVSTQIQKTQRPLSDIKALQGDQKWKMDLRRGSVKQMRRAEQFLEGIGFAGAQVMRDADPTWHERWRNKRNGRVTRRRSLNTFVARELTLKRYIAKKQSHVGQAKAGWMKAAVGAGVKGLPVWIKKHTQPGEWVNNSRGGKIEVIFGNKVPYIQQAGRDLRIIERALENRSRNIYKEIETVLKKRTDAFNAKMRASAEERSFRVVSALQANRPIRITAGDIA